MHFRADYRPLKARQQNKSPQFSSADTPVGAIKRFGYKDGLRMANYNLAGQAAGNLALEFIYGGPHTMFSNMRHSKSQGGTQPDPNP
jgi:hypothetical protein